MHNFLTAWMFFVAQKKGCCASFPFKAVLQLFLFKAVNVSTTSAYVIIKSFESDVIC